MDFFEKNNFPNNSEFFLKRDVREEKKFNLVLKTKNDKVIGFGTYAPDFSEGEIDFFVYYNSFDYSQIQEVQKNQGLFFLLSNDHYYACPSLKINLTAIKSENIKELKDMIENIKK